MDVLDAGMITRWMEHERLVLRVDGFGLRLRAFAPAAVEKVLERVVGPTKAITLHAPAGGQAPEERPPAE